VSDFLSRLVARSSGEKTRVRPRIAPAFTQLQESGRKAPAGEVLRDAPETMPAIAPLPVEPPRRAEKIAEPSRQLSAFLVTKASKELRPQTSSLNGAVPSANPEESPEKNEREAGGSRVRQKEIVVLASTPLPAADREEARPRVEKLNASVVHPGAPPVFQTVRADRESRNEFPVARNVNAVPGIPPAFPAVRPVRNAEPHFEIPKKKTSGEPTIQVTIGKIEVRASIAPSKPTEKKLPAGAMSLEEYQRMRSRRSAG
jgi:hypothetical protein